LTDEFKQRHAPSMVDKWRRTKDIWSRQQEATESVNDYISFMQAAAQKAGMDEGTLIHQIIRGLKPDIRLFVLHNGAQTVHVFRTF
jgi:Retrotransposon gag protein